MPTLSIQCDNCMLDEEITSFDALGAAKLIPQCHWCGNDVCKGCKDSEHPEYHKDCYREEKEND
jgi:hypothetical protein